MLACSALKESYRQQMLEGIDGAQIVCLKGSYDLIWSRLSMRKDHYMKTQMLENQFETLEEPTGALTVDISKSVSDIVEEILIGLNAKKRRFERTMNDVTDRLQARTARGGIPKMLVGLY